MADNDNQITKTGEKRASGRPETSDDEKDLMLTKLEPYLKSGLSLRKSILEAGIEERTFYRIKNRDPHFASKIAHFQQYVSVLVNSSIIKHLHELVRKQAGYTMPDGTRVEAQTLNREDLAFIQWYTATSNLTKEEYGNRATITGFDPESELQKLQEIIDASLDLKIADPNAKIEEKEEEPTE